MELDSQPGVGYGPQEEQHYDDRKNHLAGQIAERAGLLSQQVVETWLREQLRARHQQEFFAAMERMALLPDPPVMSPEEVTEEIRAMRAERRTRHQ